MNYDELVQRLRAFAKAWEPYEAGKINDEAADAIESLQARVAELEADRRNLLDTTLVARACVSLQKDLNAANDRAERAESELAAARAECLRRQTIIGEVALERDAARALLPGVYYMDPPDGGNVDLLEQWNRMAKDALRYRWLRRNPTYLGWEHDCPPEFIDANVDAALAAPEPDK